MYQRIVKTIFDLFISFTLLVILFPLLFFLSLALFLYFKKNPFFFQERIGLNEQPFTIWKFRSMSDQRNAKGEYLPDDKRLNSFGKFLRQTGIDELPQLVNIIKGEMSFIGPRPLLPEYLPLYPKEVRERHSIKPGITGLAQIQGGNSLDWNKRFVFDLLYLNNISFWLDIKIAAKTIFPLFSSLLDKNIGKYDPK